MELTQQLVGLLVSVSLSVKGIPQPPPPHRLATVQVRGQTAQPSIKPSGEGNPLGPGCRTLHRQQQLQQDISRCNCSLVEARASRSQRSDSSGMRMLRAEEGLWCCLCTQAGDWCPSERTTTFWQIEGRCQGGGMQPFSFLKSTFVTLPLPEGTSSPWYECSFPNLSLFSFITSTFKNVYVYILVQIYDTETWDESQF